MQITQFGFPTSVPVLGGDGAAGGFPKNVQKFVRRVTSSRLSHRRPESDKYLFRNCCATTVSLYEYTTLLTISPRHQRTCQKIAAGP